MNYQPKGGMCASCKKINEDCSSLDFTTMRVIEIDGNTVTVKCDEFKNGQILKKLQN
jgi:hypothetical protein